MYKDVPTQSVHGIFSRLSMTIHVGLARAVYIHRIWPYIWWSPCQNYRIYTVYIWIWPTLHTRILSCSVYIHGYDQPYSALHNASRACSTTGHTWFGYSTKKSGSRRWILGRSVRAAYLWSQIISGLFSSFFWERRFNKVRETSSRIIELFKQLDVQFWKWRISLVFVVILVQNMLVLSWIYIVLLKSQKKVWQLSKAFLHSGLQIWTSFGFEILD